MTHPAVAIEDLSLGFGTFSLRNVDFALAAGEVLVVLGPNGAGKSVTLETIAGFHRPEAGRIVIRGRDVTALPPEKRRVGLLFQNFGLFPHLTVAANVAFGLRARRRAALRHETPAFRRDVAGLLARFGIEHLADRIPQYLSPGEKQRVALARALAMQPDLFLFDEPFSALDTRTRDALRDELKVFLREAGAPAIFVTHDQTDASVLADTLAIMDRGEIVQIGAVADVFHAPANVFVADFIGVENILRGRLMDRSDGIWRVAVADRVIHACGDGLAGDPPRDVSVCIRAEDVALGPADGAPSPQASEVSINRLPMRVVAVTSLGALCKVTLDGGFPLVAYLTKRDVRALGLVTGGSAVAAIDAAAVHLLAAP